MQPDDVRAKLLAFVHLCGSSEVAKADLRVGRSGSMRLILKAQGKFEPEDPIPRDTSDP